MRICLYTESALPMLGGQELVVDALARSFTALGHETVVLAPQPRHHLRSSDEDLPYRVVRHPRFLSTRRFLGWYGHYLTRTYREFPFDVLHCHSVYPTGYIAARCSAIDDVPVVITSHCGDVCPSSRLLKKPGLPARFSVALERASASIAIGRFTEECYRHLCPRIGPIVPIPNGVDVGRFSSLVERPADLKPDIRPAGYFLFLGSLLHRKGADLQLTSFAMTEGINDLHLVVGGSGSEETALRRQADRLGISDRVHFLGRVDGDTKTWLVQNTLCMVIPSRISEGFPLVLMEAHAAGRPVIGTCIPGLRDVVCSGQTGLLVPPDSPTELTGALSRMAHDGELRNRYGAKAYRMAVKHDWSRVAESHLALFSGLLAGPRAELGSRSDSHVA